MTTALPVDQLRDRGIVLPDRLRHPVCTNSNTSRVAVTLTTNDVARELTVAPRADGVGSSANGGTLLCLALATRLKWTQRSEQKELPPSGSPIVLGFPARHPVKRSSTSCGIRT